ncbi:MAG TPA: rod shape-determining protein MreC [Candidatus Acidoferrales bacterium]|jgi:rod shape-determining protein MreC|nr:rod shape-determining protein MreC [Candidatus Acidoferrales bacterium]
MLNVYSRHRSLALLVAVVFTQVLLLAFQIKRDRDVPLIRYWAADLVTPVGRAGTWTSSKIRGVWTGYIALHGARVESARLQSELDRLRLQNYELETEAGEAHRLQLLLDFRQAHPEAPMIAAQVIGASADPTSHTLFIDRGIGDHIRRDMAVITPEGIVGKIVEVFNNNTAQVLLMNDKDSGVGALFDDSRVHGVVKGTGDPLPVMDYVVNDEKVHPGEVILTSGEDRIFPKGLPVGVVKDASQAMPFQIIHVEPAVHLDRLEDVLILLTRQDVSLKPAEIPVDPNAATSTPAAPPASASPQSQSPAAKAPAASPAPEAR